MGNQSSTVYYCPNKMCDNREQQSSSIYLLISLFMRRRVRATKQQDGRR